MNMDISKKTNDPIDFEKLSPIEYFGLNIVVPKQVYGPMEDTDLSIRFLRDWLSNFKKRSNISQFKQKKHSLRVLEMGVGCGVLSLFLISRLIRENINIYHNGVDINPIAIETAQFNAQKNQLSHIANFYQGDLFTPLTTFDQKEPFDFILFNPPYLASETEIIDDKNREWIDLAWEGGENGYEVTLEFLSQIDPFLSKTGEMFYISSTRVDQTPIQKKLNELNLKFVKKYEKRVFFETIVLSHYRRLG